MREWERAAGAQPEPGWEPHLDSPAVASSDQPANFLAAQRSERSHPGWLNLCPPGSHRLNSCWSKPRSYSEHPMLLAQRYTVVPKEHSAAPVVNLAGPQ